MVVPSFLAEEKIIKMIITMRAVRQTQNFGWDARFRHGCGFKKLAWQPHGFRFCPTAQYLKQVCSAVAPSKHLWVNLVDGTCVEACYVCVCSCLLLPTTWQLMLVCWHPDNLEEKRPTEYIADLKISTEDILFRVNPSRRYPSMAIVQWL